jgi:hypothetical protein
MGMELRIWGGGWGLPSIDPESLQSVVSPSSRSISTCRLSLIIDLSTVDICFFSGGSAIQRCAGESDGMQQSMEFA